MLVDTCGNTWMTWKMVIYVPKSKSKSQSAGKQFESDFKKSTPPSSLLIRLNDSPQAFSQSKLTRFTHRTPYDFLLFDTEHRTLICLELKSTKHKSISFEDVNDDEKQNRMVHKHQIIGLMEASKYLNVIAGFLFDFRDEQNECERCYFQRIQDFNGMVQKIDKKSFNELDLLMIGSAVKVDGVKRKVYYRWNIQKMLNDINEKFSNN